MSSGLDITRKSQIIRARNRCRSKKSALIYAAHQPEVADCGYICVGGARLGLVGGLVDPVYTPHRKPAGQALGGVYCLD